jgi:hypothetical protein
MKKINEKQTLTKLVDLLEEFVDAEAQAVEYEPGGLTENTDHVPDLAFSVGDYRFIVEFTKTTQLGAIAHAIEQLNSSGAKNRGFVPLLVVPFMGPSVMAKCAEVGISWIDLSGNADLTAQGLRVYVRGKENKFSRPGRKENPFAPKSSRVARRLLYQPERAFSQRELANETGLGEGFISRLAKTLEQQHLVIRDDQARLLAREPTLLLEAWAQGYDFHKHDILRGHVAGRSGEEVQANLSKVFQGAGISHAATGLGAAWLYSKFTAFRTVSFYLKELPPDDVLQQAGFREVSSGANVWLVLPKDFDVFHAVAKVGEIPCVHPIQVYLDLQSHPERSEEAAAELRKMLELS